MAPRMRIETDANPTGAAPEETVAHVSTKVEAPKATVSAQAEPAKPTSATITVEQQKAEASTAPQVRVDATVTVQPKEAPAQKSHPRVVAEVATDEVEDAAPTPEEREQPKEEKSAPQEKKDHSLTGWVSRTFPGHEHAFWGAVVALIIALLIFAIGFWKVFLIVCLVVIGIAFGQVLDGDPKIIRAIRALFPSDRER